jgi:hypothetical protein
MTEDKEVLTIYLGETDIYEWTQGVGKTVLMPELLVGCEEVLYNDIDEVHCARIEAIVRGNSKAFDFNVQRKNITDTIEKILTWALQEEEYEICERVKNLNEFLENKNNTF